MFKCSAAKFSAEQSEKQSEIMATAQLLLDKSKANKSGSFSIRIQIYHQGKQDKFATKLSASADQFNEAQSNKARSKAVQVLRKQMDEIRLKADAICVKLGGGYTKEKFKRIFYSNISYTTKGQLLDLQSLYDEYKIHLRASNASLKTLVYHTTSLNSFLNFHPGLTLQDVTPAWLHSYENWNLAKGNSLTAIGTYLRSLRTIYTKAVEEGLISRELFPFGKRKYQVVTAVSAKAFLTPEEVHKLKEYKPRNEYQARAIDMWFFLYYTNGIPPVDAIQLMRENIQGEYIVFRRQKTQKSRSEAKEVVAVLHPEARKILERRGNKDKDNPYLFPFLKPGMTTHEKTAAIDDWKRYTNRVLNRIGLKLKLRTSLYLYAARHTWATTMKVNGVPVADISDGLGHANLTITANYLGTIVTDKVKAMSALL